MKIHITIFALMLTAFIQAQNKKTIVATYEQTIELVGMEGACLYKIIFKDDKGSQVILTDIFHGQYNEVLMKMFCDSRTLSEAESEKMNNDGQFDKTVKSSKGKKFKVTYEILQGDSQCWSLEAALLTK